MEWHVDDVLYNPPQVEVVLTIENTSDCQTMWEETDIAAASTSTKSFKQVETKPNSAIMLKAGSVNHRVSSLKYGKRTILKFVFIREDANMVSGAQVHLKQFEKEGKNMKKVKSQKKNTSKRGKR
mmetsp:Transcript_9928/g.14697  ORF Transcript_9928/g.14697 Transcript_9928/m.14697 type:complete len:125 (+) Transcript_9928:125-499(+)